MSHANTDPLIREANDPDFAARILRDMNDGLLVLDAHGHFLYFNENATRMLDLHSALSGKSYASLMTESHSGNDAFHQLVLDSVYDKSVIHEGTAPYQTASGEKRTLHVTSSFLLDNDRANHDGVVIILSDVTQVEQLQLRQKESAVIFTLLMSGTSIYLFIWSTLVYLGISPPAWVMNQLVQVLAVVMLAVSLKTTSFSLGDLGLRLDNPRQTLVPSMLITVGGFAALVVLKVVLLRVAPSFFPTEAPFWDWSVGNFSDVIYPLTVVLQEFLARSVMQGNLKRIFVGKNAGAMSIVLSSLLFGVLHIAYGLPYMIAAMMLGVLGILYDKHGNIWGLSIIHYVLGEAVTFLRYTI